MKTYSRVCAQVDLDSLLHNVEQMRQNIHQGTKIMGVIKTDAYGHGAVPIGRELERLDVVWGYATATVEEDFKAEWLKEADFGLRGEFSRELCCPGKRGNPCGRIFVTTGTADGSICQRIRQ